MPAIRIDKAGFSYNLGPANSAKIMRRSASTAVRTTDVLHSPGRDVEQDIHFPSETSERKVFRTKNGKV
jgi:hypothetical protein